MLVILDIYPNSTSAIASLKQLCKPFLSETNTSAHNVTALFSISTFETFQTETQKIHHMFMLPPSGRRATAPAHRAKLCISFR